MASRWILYCITEGVTKYVYSNERPTTCPDDHSFDDPSSGVHLVDSVNAYVEDTLLFTSKNIINNDTFATFDNNNNIIMRYDGNNGYIYTKPLHVIQNDDGGVTLNSLGVQLQGSARRWRSEYLPVTCLTTVNTSMNKNIVSVDFNMNTEIYYITHLPPSYAEDSNVLIAVNWTRNMYTSASSSEGTTSRIRWSLGLHWVNTNDQYPPLLAIEAEETVSDVVGVLNRTILTNINGMSKKQRSMLSGSLKRVACDKPDETVVDADNIQIISIEIIYQVSELD